MISKKQLLKSWKIYAILDDGLFPDARQLLRKFSDLTESPIDVLQLRFKNLAKDSVYNAAKKIVRTAKKKNLPIIINDRPEIALALGCSGIHLGKGDISAKCARRILGKGAIIGRTIRGIKDLEFIDKKEVDYVAIGPVFRTPLKPELKKISRQRLREVQKRTQLPLVAIGGINKRNVREVAACGIKTVAFVRYGITEKDTNKRIKELRKAMIC
jgi:thiamine-phosphate pyrophosphorylase